MNACDYNRAREKVVSACSSCTIEDLSRLKLTFAERVNSIRTLDNIKTVAQLIDILERRDALNQDNIGCLSEILFMLNKYDVLQWIIRNDRLDEHVTNIKSSDQSTVSHNLPSRHRRIYDIISTEIGVKWKVLARELGIGEGKIDELEEKHRCISERVREMLLYHERKYTLQSWSWFPLLDALSKSRRNDLRKEIQNILSEP